MFCCFLIVGLVRLQVEAAWVAAAQVVISGAVGPRADFVNGHFEQVEWEVYRKVGEPDRWLFVDKDGEWMVGSTAGKDNRKTESAGWAHSVASAGGMPPPAGSGRWQVVDGNGKWVEQTVEVELVSAAQAREWTVRQAQQVGASPRSRKQGHQPFPAPRSVLVLVCSLLPPCCQPLLLLPLPCFWCQCWCWCCWC